MSDLNKTDLTRDVTEAVIVWLKEKGFRPVQTEVRIAEGWIADIAGTIRPSQTSLLDLKLISKAPTWNPENSALTDWIAKVREMKREVYTSLVEVKTSRGDFTKDHKWDHPIPVNLAYLAVPKGLISESEWPEGWGILEFSDGSIRARRWARLVNVSPDLHRDVLYYIAMRLHSTTDEFSISRRNTSREEGDRMKAMRLSEIIAGVCAIVESQHEDFDLVMALSKLSRANLDGLEVERLRLLHGVGKHVYEGMNPARVSSLRRVSSTRRFLLRERLNEQPSDGTPASGADCI